MRGAADAPPSASTAAPTTAAPTTAAPTTAAPTKDRFGVARIARLGAWIRSHCMEIDPRTAGLYRIVIGFLLTANAIRHWTVAQTYYSNDGLLTNHWKLFKPGSPWEFSFFHAFSSLAEVHVAFVLCVICHLCLMIGWRSRIFAVASFIACTSMDSRILLVENGGYVVVNLTAMYAMFLPIERRFSVDAWLRSYRDHRETRIEHLRDRGFARGRNDLFVSAAVMLAVVNLGFVYFFNVVNKSGTTWRIGDTVHYVLHIDRMVTGLAAWMRGILPLFALKAITWGTLSVEAMLCVLILSPKARRVTRPAAMVGMALLHTSFGLMMRLGPFSWFMIGWSAILPTTVHWEAVASFGRKRARGATVVLAPRSRLALGVGRLLARLDAYQLLDFVPAESGSTALIAVRRQAGTDRPAADAATLEEASDILAGALPYAFTWWRFARLIGARRWLAIVAARRAALERFFFAGRPVDEEEPAFEAPGPTPLQLRVAKQKRRVRSVFLAWLTACFALQAWLENKCIPPELKFTQPDLMKATTHRFRTLQGWGMFSPNPIQEDGVFVVDAYTVSGKRIDPMTGEAPVLDLTNVRGMGLGQIEQDYGNRIRSDRNDVYRAQLEEYLQRWHTVTGDPGDEIVAYDIWWVTDKCPRPGLITPTDPKNIAIRTWRKKGWKQPAGAPVIPPSPKIESAGT